MKAALHIKNQTKEHTDGKLALVAALQQRGVEVIEKWTPETPIDFIVSIGGDGTLLNAVHQIGGTGVPVVGINFGHLGFLTTAGRDDIEKLADCLTSGRYTIENRTMLEVKTAESTLYALNEVYLHRQEQSPLLHTQVEIDGYMVATYAADGLIVATPTGSTAYSLSCGGPILAPGSGSIVITPIAAHTLTLRPVVLSDNVSLRLHNEEADIVCILGVDSYVTRLSGTDAVEIKKAPYQVRLIRIEQQNFFSAIRDKLMWGM